MDGGKYSISYVYIDYKPWIKPIVQVYQKLKSKLRSLGRKPKPSNVANFDKIILPQVNQTFPHLSLKDIIGVQPLAGPPSDVDVKGL